MRKVMGIDGSFTMTGYAVLRGLGVNDVVDAGRLRGKTAKHSTRDRVEYIVGELLKIVDEFQPDVVVTEWPDLHARKQKRGKGGQHDNAKGTARCGFIQGAIYEALRGYLPPTAKLVAAESTVWSAGAGKINRQQAIHAMYYPISEQWQEKDSGGDMRDAIGIARWFLVQAQN